MTDLSSLVLRQAQPADAPALASMRWADSTEDGAASPQPAPPDDEFRAHFVPFIHRALAGGQWAIWIAELDGRAVAHIYVHLVGKVPRPGRPFARWGYVTAVYALPEVRNTGIGSRLLRRVIDWALEQRLELLLVWPSERAVPFYERAGFTPSPDALELHLPH